MKEIFKDILAIEGVSGILLFSSQGRIVFKEFAIPLSKNPERQDWKPLINTIKNVKEADFIYENNRVHIRKSAAGYLLVLMELFTPAAMVRLTCEMALPALNKLTDDSKGIKKFFKW